MIIYEYLFYIGYKTGIKTKNFDDCPILGGVAIVISPFMCHILVIRGFLNYLDIIPVFEMTKWLSIIFTAFVVGGLCIYYAYKGRSKRIIAKYDRKRKKSNSFFYCLPSVVVVLSYFIVSVLLMFLSIEVFRQ